jgi:hypothetical protein
VRRASIAERESADTSGIFAIWRVNTGQKVLINVP